MPVIAPDGVVGTVQRVAGDRVDVQLAVDSGSGIDVVDERTGARGFVRGTGDQSRYVCKRRAHAAHRRGRTSAISSSRAASGALSRGHPGRARDQGRQARLRHLPGGRSRRPTVDFSRLEEVLIITSPPERRAGRPAGRTGRTRAVRNTAVPRRSASCSS